MNIYLDIDGVLLDYGENPASYSREFIDYLVNNYDTYWLSTHCRGDSIPTQQHLSRFFTDQLTLKNLAKIRPTNWEQWKTEGIDFSTPFLWIDDDYFEDEHKELERNNVGTSVLLVDLVSEHDQLKSIVDDLKMKRLPTTAPDPNLS